MKELIINDVNYEVIRLLGKGKGGYSYLVRSKQGFDYVAKVIHHEPCDFYQFGNKLESELQSYIVLKNAGIKVPLLIEVDKEKEILLKEYVEGPTALEILLKQDIPTIYFHNIHIIERLAKQANINIDYFPSNFILENDELIYVDYEHNEYSPKWDYRNWGRKYWYYTEDLVKYLKEQNLPVDNNRIRELP